MVRPEIRREGSVCRVPGVRNEAGGKSENMDLGPVQVLGVAFSLDEGSIVCNISESLATSQSRERLDTGSSA